MQMHYRSPETVLGLSSVLNPSSIMSSPGFKQTIRYQDFVTSDMLPSDLGLDTVMENEENQENCKLDRTFHDLAEIVESRPDPLDDVKSSLHLESSLKLVKEDELVEPSDDEEFTQPNLFRYHQDDIETMSRSGTLPNTTTPHRKRVPLTYLSSHYRITVEDDTVIDDLLPTIQKLVKRENITVFGRNCEGGEKEIQLFERLFDVVSLYVVGAHA